MFKHWHPRGADRLPDPVWRETLLRVRAEFDEMPCLRVTPDQARLLFGLPGRATSGVLNRLEDEGYLARTPQGEFVRNRGGS